VVAPDVAMLLTMIVQKPDRGNAFHNILKGYPFSWSY
jgi:hypothetical protein